MKPYGFELILDMHGCDVSTFTRKSIENFMIALCEEIKMQREDLHFWDYDGVPESERPTQTHLLGVSAVQFISTSNIVIHTLELLKAVSVWFMALVTWRTSLWIFGQRDIPVTVNSPCPSPQRVIFAHLMFTLLRDSLWRGRS